MSNTQLDEIKPLTSINDPEYRPTIKEVVGLLDCAYDIMELWQPEGEYNKQLRQNWLKRAKVHGAIPSY